jgi:hypothetical protein
VAGFCNSCGAQLTEGTKFCNKCGAAVTTTAALAATIPAPSSTPPVTQGSGTVLKVILAVLGVFALLGVLVAGSCLYIGYRIKKRAHEFNQEMGGNVPPYTGKREPCAMLSSEAAASAIGQPITSVEQAGRSICTYHFGTAPGQRVDITYTWKGGAMAMDLTHAAMKRVSGTETLTPIPGVGDDAFLAPDGSGLMMRKGDVMVNIDLRANGVSTDAAKKMATLIAGNL